MIEKMEYMEKHFDWLRSMTMCEPRGHREMVGAILTEPVTEDGDFGVFFMHNEGYSTMCGHAIIALTRFAIETGLTNGVGHSAPLPTASRFCVWD